MQITLNVDEIEELMKQEPGTAADGGWQSLLVSLQGKVNGQTGALTLSEKDLERIQRYAFNYGNGGWEGTLKRVFQRHLGPRLGLDKNSN